MGRKKEFGVRICTLVLALMAAVPAWASDVPKGRTGPGDPAPLFSADDLEGNRMVLKDILGSGNVVFLNFWGLRCANCIEEIRYLNPLFDKYRRQGAVFLGVNVDGAGSEMIRQLMPKMPHVPRYTVLPDPEFKIPDMYNLSGAPLSLVIGRDGKIAFRHEDFKPGDEKGMEEALRNAILKKD